MTDIRVRPWAHGPAELFRHADEHYRLDGDTDRRLALIGFDNAIEVCVDTFVGLYPRHRRGYVIRREDREPILQNFHTKVAFLERYAVEEAVSLGEVSIDEVIWYHQLRNELYHSGNGMTPERRHLAGIRDAARGVFRALFDCDVAAADEPPARSSIAGPEPPTDGSDRLAFLAAYIDFERALAARSTSGKPRYLPQMWQEYRISNARAAQFDDLVERARVLRNAVAHGEDLGEMPAGPRFDQLTVDLQRLAGQVASQAPDLEAAGKAKPIRGRRLAELATKVSREVDPDRHGLTTLEILDALVSRGIVVADADPGRDLYSALNAAHDLFEHGERGRYTWVVEPVSSDGIFGAELLAQLETVRPWIDEAQGGRHYQEMVRRLEAGGIPVRGPDKGRTMQAALNSKQGRHALVRTGRGIYRFVGREPGTRSGRATDKATEPG